LAEETLESAFRAASLHVVEGRAGEQVAGVVVEDGERVAVDAVAGLELALEVDRPHLVRCIRVQRRRPWMLPVLPPASLLDQPVALEDVEDGASARQFGRGELLPEQSMQLARAPAVIFFSSTTCASISAAVRCGHVFGARLCSLSPSAPSSWWRRAHLYPV